MSGEKRLTVFGLALADLFTALVVFNVTLCLVFAISYWYARGVNLAACRADRAGNIDPISCVNALRASAMPGWLTVVDRAAIAATGTLVIGTAIGTAWEMGRARTGPQMIVHVPAHAEPTDDRIVSETPDRRVGPPDRRGHAP